MSKYSMDIIIIFILNTIKYVEKRKKEKNIAIFREISALFMLR